MWKASRFFLLGLYFSIGLFAQENQTSANQQTQANLPLVRLKDLARIEGLRDNQLTGLGLVVGLNGQGDSSTNAALMEMISSLMTNLGAQVKPEDLRSKNAAVVAITATLPAFTRPGDALDVQVASLGDAKSLAGGILLQTPLRAADGNVYAAAQGRVLAPTGRGTISTSGTIPRGALLERAVPLPEIQSEVVFLLHRPDFSTAQKIVEALRQAFSETTATVRDPGRVVWQVGNADRIALIAQAENLRIAADSTARVVVNRQTGVVVMGQNVRLGAATVSVRGAKISIGERRTSEQAGLRANTSVEDLVSLLQNLGLATDTIIDILEALSRAGALFGTLEVL
jgi:flagellar P-ring protein precursor FlgI